jgi:hypothetical protein
LTVSRANVLNEVYVIKGCITQRKEGVLLQGELAGFAEEKMKFGKIGELQETEGKGLAGSGKNAEMKPDLAFRMGTQYYMM